MSKTADFREEITAKIITAIENGTAPWQQPWNGAEGPQNGITHRKYNGINTVILSLAMMTMDGEKKRDPRWFGYRQLVQQNNGAYVRKGERGTKVLLWRPTIGIDENGNREITSVLQRTFTVFHASQIEGIPDYVPPKQNIIEAHEKAEKIAEMKPFTVPAVITFRCRPRQISGQPRDTTQHSSMKPVTGLEARSD